MHICCKRIKLIKTTFFCAKLAQFLGGKVNNLNKARTSQYHTIKLLLHLLVAHFQFGIVVHLECKIYCIIIFKTVKFTTSTKQPMKKNFPNYFENFGKTFIILEKENFGKAANEQLFTIYNLHEFKIVAVHVHFISSVRYVLS